jgi:hypothetical protein
MTTAYTSLLGLALPVTGELSGTWGTTVNDSITSLLDSAIAGTTVLNTDADVTLSTTVAVANQARQAILLWTAGGTVTRTIIAPAQSKLYVVVNKTSSTQSIKLCGPGPTTGILIGAGSSATCAWDGSDFIKISGSGSGGATGGGTDQIFYQNGQTVTTDYTITTNSNAGTFGPVSIATGVTVTIPTGSVWSIV